MRSGEADGYFSNYAEYSKAVRTWLVAYGIGGPVLLVTNESFASKLTASGHATLITYLFLIGVSLQVLLALLNKWCAYAKYAMTVDVRLRADSVYIVMDWVNDQIWIDVLMDLASVACFAWATLMIMLSFAK